jgi:hypothetical protein
VKPWPLPEEEITPLLETVRKIAERATKGTPVDMEFLRRTIQHAVQCYRVDACCAAYVEKKNIHAIAAPARMVIEILKNDANSGEVFDALAGGDSSEGGRRLDALIDNLERLAACAAQHTPDKRLRKRPARIDLRLFVGELANGWLILTKTDFTHRWQCGTPTSLGAQFAYEVVQVVDSSSLPALEASAASERRPTILVRELRMPC